MVSMIDIDSLRPGDRAAWEVLARGYKAFYRDPMPDEAYEQTWRRLLDGTELHGLGARIDGALVGIAHYFFHPTFWSAEACYLQDLFVDKTLRGRGAGRALIDGVARAARDRGATRLYWHTKEDNARARVLYDKVARFAGFIRYQYPLLGISLPVGDGPDAGDEQLDAEPVVEVRVAGGHRRGAFDQPRVAGSGLHREVDLGQPLILGALLLR
jgi:GNAT superfamily N-acetyltransferase